MTIFLNNAASSYPKPKCVAKALSEAISNTPSAAYRGGISTFDAFDDVRTRLAALTNTDSPERIILTPNATFALNTAILGLNLKEGDVVLTSVTEHNSVLRPLYTLRDKGIQLIFAACDEYGRIDAEDFSKKAIRFEPKLSVFTHASNVTGAINDAAYLCYTAKQVGSITLLDASQTAGIAHIGSNITGADMIALTGHKYLLGPQGIGALCVKGEILPEPIIYGGTGILSATESMPATLPMRLEAGTGNEPAAAALAAALEWQSENPIKNDKLNFLHEYLIHGLKDAGADVIAPEGNCTPVVSFTVKGLSADDTGYILNNGYEIICRSGLHCAPLIHKYLKYNDGGTVRLSLSRFTKKKDCDEVIRAVREIKRTYT